MDQPLGLRGEEFKQMVIEGTIKKYCSPVTDVYWGITDAEGNYNDYYYDDEEWEEFKRTGIKLGHEDDRYSEKMGDDESSDFADYYYSQTWEDETGYYDSGEGSLSWMGDEFANMDQESTETYLLYALGYLALSVVGLIAFPPMVICFYMTDGDLNTCSLGIWGNSYQSDEYYGDYYNDSYTPDERQDDPPTYSWNYFCMDQLPV